MPRGTRWGQEKSQKQNEFTDMFWELYKLFPTGLLLLSGMSEVIKMPSFRERIIVGVCLLISLPGLANLFL